LRGSRDTNDERITNDTNGAVSTRKTVAASDATGVGNAQTREASASGGSEAGGETSQPFYGRCSGAGAVQAVQARLGGYRGKDAQRAGHPVCLPVLPGIASRSGPRARIPQIAARAMDQMPPGGRIVSAKESAKKIKS
jgi:hypothetical protein